ncbi:hypothetical protein N2382_04930 [SAR92 clade bacterium H921]|nr:hypothetical protein [SAR92 clade bacterium H921]
MKTADPTSGQKSAFSRLLNECKEEFSDFMQDLNNKKNDIENARKTILVDDDDTSLQTQINKACDSADENCEEISRLLTDIKQKHTCITEAESGYFPKIESTYNQTEELMSKFQTSSQLIYGDENNGIQNELEQMLSKSEELLRQVENTFAGATNTELAKAFHDQKKSYRKAKWFWSGAFICSVAGMAYLGFLAMGIKSTDNYFYDLGKHLVPLGPLIWFGLFASRQQSQDKRLQEEYAHKEAVTKTYVGHQRQLGNLDDNNNLLAELADATIKTITSNPSSTLGKINPKQDLPSSAVADKIKDSVTQK